MKDEGKGSAAEKPNIKGDKVNIIMLLLMYLFQGIVNGFTNALPIILQNRKVSYADQAEFSITHYPFNMKILWAPIVDCVFFERFGRRKTWVIPMQYLMGLILLFASMRLDDWLGSEDGTRKPQIHLLSLMFVTATFCSSVQDVAVDGWSITMLQRRNIGYAAICQSIGGIVGSFLSNPVFLLLDSKDICNRFRSVPRDHGFVTSADYMFYWSLVYIVATTLILVFKKDNSLEVVAEDDENCECRLSLTESYKHLWNILKLRPILLFSLMLLTFYIGFAPSMGVCNLKMIDAGISKDSLVLFTMPALPFQIILSIAFRRCTSGPGAMRFFLRNHLLLLITTILLAVVLFFASSVKDEFGVFPVWYYCVLFFLYNTRSVIRHLMVLSVNSYFCRISDPRFGGIYLTLLITMSNLGGYWPQTLSLWAVDPLTIRNCSGNESSPRVRSCNTVLDGFFVETALAAVICILWRLWAKGKIFWLEKLDASEWIIERRKSETVEHEALMVLNKGHVSEKVDA